MQRSHTKTELKALDKSLLADLQKEGPQAAQKTLFRNERVGELARNSSSKAGFRALEKYLTKLGTFDINTETRRWIDTDKRSFRFVLARAASTDMWPMGTNYWVRDNVLISARLLFGERTPESIALGREMLLSALTFMSSVKQLERFEAIIASRVPRFIRNAYHWPHIFVSVADNLNGSREEPWTHKQDAWQMLVWYLLDAIEQKLVPIKALSNKHKRFIGFVIPFLGKIRFWESENSGSWEEIPAVRTSVVAWDHMLSVRLGELSKSKQFAFLNEVFEEVRPFLGGKFKRYTLDQYVGWMDGYAADTMLRHLPFEAPRYKKNDPRYRTADAALMYLLHLNYPRFLAARTGKPKRWVAGMERLILKEVETLFDKRTGGIHRYAGDSYQRAGFFRHAVSQELTEMYGGVSGDASSNFQGRGRIVPKGRQAAWAHFTWQLSAWAGRRFLEVGGERYRKMHEKYFVHGLRMVTGSEEASLDMTAAGTPQVIPIDEALMPECYISETTDGGKSLVFPTPHTPLNWAVAEMRDAFAVRRQVLDRRK